MQWRRHKSSSCAHRCAWLVAWDLLWGQKEDWRKNRRENIIIGGFSFNKYMYL